jgi:hypothetical protein
VPWFCHPGAIVPTRVGAAGAKANPTLEEVQAFPDKRAK